MARITNLVQNGRAKYTSGATVEVRRNYSLNPIGDTFTSGNGYSAANGSTITVVPGQGIRVAVPSGGLTDSGIAFRSAIDALVVGQIYTVSLDVVGEVSDSWRLRIQGGMTETAQNGNYVLVSAGETKRLSITFTAAQATSGDIYLLRGTSSSASQSIVKRVLVEKGDSPLAYFDGSYSPDPDLKPSWTWTANASVSVLSGTLASTIESSNRVRNIQSMQWPISGTSIRSIPRDSNNDTFISPGGDSGTMRLGMVAGRPTAIRARGYLPFPQTGSISNMARSVTLWNRTGSYVGVLGTPGQNIAGEFISELVTTLPADATEAFVRLYNGASVGNGEIFWTDVIVAQADTEAEALAAVQTYFDGDSEPFRYGPTAQLVVPKWSGTPGQSSSYFDYEEPWIPNTTWDTMPDRVYELGADRGMFYPPNADGVPWSGLISVKEKLDENAPTMYYIDGIRYYADTPAGEFKASLEAFTYPDEFINYSGYFEETDDVPGLYYDEQATKTFGLSYRTKVGDGQYGPDIFYKIHLVYNVIAVVTNRDYTTVNGSPEASAFTWDLYTIPAESSVAPINTAHLIIDSRKIPGPKLKALEDLLYGDGVNPPELPSPDDVRSILL